MQEIAVGGQSGAARLWGLGDRSVGDGALALAVNGLLAGFGRSFRPPYALGGCSTSPREPYRTARRAFWGKRLRSRR
jgi:hypothetical protein